MVSQARGAIVAVIGQLTVTVGDDEAVLEGPPAPGPVAELPPGADAIREFTRFDAAGRYRPLPGSLDLRGAWRVRYESLAALDAALDAVYPLATVHAAQWAEGTLRIVSLDAVLRRQTGRYEPAAGLSELNRERASAVLCGQCAKTPVWPFRDGAAVAAGLEPVPLPCPEPCSVLVSLCREAAAWQQARPASARPDPALPFASFDEPGNPTREALLAAMEPAA